MGKYQVCCHKDNTGNAPHKHFRQRHGKVNAVHPIICIWQEQKRGQRIFRVGKLSFKRIA